MKLYSATVGVASAAIVAALALTGCSTSAPEATSPAADAPLASLVPEGTPATLTVGTAAANPPFESVEGGKIVGFDADLAAAVGEQLGLTLKMEDGSFDALISGLQGGRYNLVISNLYDTPERQKSVDFVDYLHDGHKHAVHGDHYDEH